MTELQIDRIIDRLNEYGTDVDSYEYGLPMYGIHLENMRAIIRRIANEGE